jgi:hypothetical protein
LITEEQWLAALADHWSSARRRRVGTIIVEKGYLSLHVVEAEARAFHHELDVIEVDELIDADDVITRSEKTTVPTAPLQVA